MRLNASEREHYKDAMRTIIKSGGQIIKYCLWFDTDLGIAECAFAIPSDWQTEDDTLKTRPLYTLTDGEFNTLTYYLHTFEVYQDNKLVAKI